MLISVFTLLFIISIYEETCRPKSHPELRVLSADKYDLFNVICEGCDYAASRRLSKDTVQHLLLLKQQIQPGGGVVGEMHH